MLGLESEPSGEEFSDLFFFFFVCGDGVSGVGSEEKVGLSNCWDSFTPAMLWVSNVWYKSCTTVALR